MISRKGFLKGLLAIPFAGKALAEAIMEKLKILFWRFVGRLGYHPKMKSKMVSLPEMLHRLRTLTKGDKKIQLRKYLMKRQREWDNHCDTYKIPRERVTIKG